MFPVSFSERKMMMNRDMMPDRDRIIFRTSLLGILTNVILVCFKAVAGFLSHSIAIVLDAVNNLSDVLSSVVTIAGARLALRDADRMHPLGHGRIEYLSALIVSILVLYAGITSMIESIRKILNPEPVSYTPVMMVLLAMAVIVKIILGRYVSRRGKLAHSTALEASGRDALNDAFLSFSVLVSALICSLTGFSLESWVGLLIAVFILRTGFHLIRETLDDILGHRADPEITHQIRDILTGDPSVLGAYDLILHNYGPDRNYGSAHLELPDTMTVAEVDRLTRRLEAEVYQKTGVIMTGIGVYSCNTTDSEAADIRNRVQERVLSHDWALQFHGFSLDTAAKTMRFDVVLSFDADRASSVRRLTEEIEQICPGYSIQITPDVDAAD